MATPAVDQTYGQRSVFGVLGQTATAPVDDDLECEDEHDALAYLMLVRSEASKIPHVMVAPRPGPQAFPPGYAGNKEKKRTEAKEARRKRNKRRQRHWDDQDDGLAGSDAHGDGRGAKKRCTAQLSYDEVSYDDLYDERKEGAEEEEDDDNDDDEDEKEVPRDDMEASVYNRQALYETGVGDARGYYHDGAYIAAEEEEEEEKAGDEVKDATGTDYDPAATDAAFSTAYRARLLAHFGEMRAHLAALALAGDAKVVVEVGPLSVRSGVFKHWLHVLRATDPRPAQVAAMDKVSVLRLLRIMQRGLEAGASTSSRSSRAGRFVRSLAGGGPGHGQLDMSPRTMRWMWALLARLPGRGELDYREVGYIRDVAKQTVMRLAHLSYDMSGEGEGGEEEGDDVKPDESAEEAVLDAEDIAMDIDSEPEDKEPEGKDVAQEDRDVAEPADTDDIEMQQRAALEMVLAVAGDFYGQRDLLAFRSPWPAASQQS